MYRCVPVKKIIARIGCLLLLLPLITSLSQPIVSAQSNVGTNYVVSADQDLASSRLELVTLRKTELSRPIIQFLAGENGNTILTMDFPGLVWNLSTKTVQVHATEPGTVYSTDSYRGIQVVRAGRFQESPPVTRISVVANDASLLKLVSVRAEPGRMTIEWPKSSSRSSRFESRQQASLSGSSKLTSRYGAREIESKSPPVAPSSRFFTPHAKPSSTGRRALVAQDPQFDSTVTSKAPSPAPNRLAQSKTASSTYQSAPGSTSAYRKPVPIQPPVAPSISYKTHHQPLSVAGENTEPVINEPTPVANHEEPPAVQDQEPSWRRSGFLKSMFSRFKRKDEPRHKHVYKYVPQDESSNVPPPQAESVQENTAAAETNQSPPVQQNIEGTAPAVVQEPAPLIYMHENHKGGAVLTVTSPNGEHLRFKSFRLQNPARFVVDFPNFSSIHNSQVTQPSGTGFLSRVRVGAFDERTGRMVFDLAGEHVSVREESRGRGDVAAFTIEHSGVPLREVARAESLTPPPPGTTIVLDAGHGGSDPGAQRGSVKEKELTLAIVQQLDKILREQGINTILTRSSDTSVSLSERVDITNQARPNAFLSVHINAMESSTHIHGIETYYQTPFSQNLAEHIHEALVSDLKAPNRNIRKARFYVVNRTTVPAVLAEVGFISNKDEREKLSDVEYQKQIATALARGLIVYLKGSSDLPEDIARRNDTHISRHQIVRPSRSVAEKAPERKRLSNQADQGTATVEPVAKNSDERVEAANREYIPSTRSGGSRLAQKGLGIKPSEEQ